ncbi:MAG TPA: DivIVA domain-containing protein [Bacteroidota bacterium]|nr:DivIVA domain-containing protein [Bacteroidota bacterium]
MTLTPLDIKKQEFKRVLRGYDAVEVNSFLEMVSVEFADALRQAKEMKERLTEAEVLLRDFRQKERDLQQVLMQAQETGARSIEHARREAELVMGDAELKANQIIERGRGEAARFKEEVLTLRARKDTLISRLKVLLNSELELIKALEAEEDDVQKDPGRGTGKVNFQVDDILKKL